MRPTRGFSVLVLVGLVTVGLAGCFGGGGSDQDTQNGVTREGEFREFDLYLKAEVVELYDGTLVPAWLFSRSEDTPGTLPGPTIRAVEGDTVRINFHVLDAPMPHTIHWHGLHVPWNMDGVPFVSQLPIGDPGGTGSPVAPEKMFSYEFKLTQSGTYFYHCHVDTAHHMDMGMYGAFIVDPADPGQDEAYDRDYTLMFDEWDKSHVHGNPGVPVGSATSGDPDAVVENLTKQLSKSGDPEAVIDSVYSQIRDYYNQNPNAHQVRQDAGVQQTNDWYPAQFPAYFPEYDTYLINGKAFPDTDVLTIAPGETIRLRFINAGFQWHAIHLHGHHMLVTHKDGYKLDSPYYADTVSIGPAERYDVYVKGDNPGPWMIHAHDALAEMNDYIAPGGMATMLCYTDGWDVSAATGVAKENTMCAEGSLHTSGEVLEYQNQLLMRRHGLA